MNEARSMELIDYAHRLAALRLCGGKDVLAARASDGRILLLCGADFANASPEQVKLLSLADAAAREQACALFAARPDVQGLALLSSPFSTRLSREGKAMRASLDDTAQIAGGRIRCAASSAQTDALPALKRNFGCFVKNEGMLTIGRTLHEAFVAALVLEKGARAELEARPFGGAVPLSAFDCALMRRVYLKKYSQIQERA